MRNIPMAYETDFTAALIINGVLTENVIEEGE